MTLLTLHSPSAATDAGWLAAADVAAVAEENGLDYRLVGGLAVTLLTHHHGVEGEVPPRETADADMGAPDEVCGDDRLPEALRARGYHREQGNRFVLDGDRRRVIDVLAPARENTLQSNQSLGALLVDRIPGQRTALALDPVEVKIAARLTDGAELSADLLLPDVRAALLLKALAYGSRYADQDAVDIWRLLVAAHAAGLGHGDCLRTATWLDAARVLHGSFASAGAMGQRRAARDPGQQARVRLLVKQVVPHPDEW